MSFAGVGNAQSLTRRASFYCKEKPKTQETSTFSRNKQRDELGQTNVARLDIFKYRLEPDYRARKIAEWRKEIRENGRIEVLSVNLHGCADGEDFEDKVRSRLMKRGVFIKTETLLEALKEIITDKTGEEGRRELEQFCPKEIILNVCFSPSYIQHVSAKVKELGLPIRSIIYHKEAKKDLISTNYVGYCYEVWNNAFSKILDPHDRYKRTTLIRVDI